MVKKIALDLEEKKHLEQEVLLLEESQKIYGSLVQGLEEKTNQRELQLQLCRKNLEILQLQLTQRSAARKWDLVWMLRLLAAMGAGYVIGKF